MTTRATGDLLASARERETGLAAFNVVTLEQARAVVRGAEEADRPVVIALSQNAVRFHDGDLRPMTAAMAALAGAASVEVGLHLDHVEDLDLLAPAVAAGYRSVMVDAGRLPYDENVEVTRAAAGRLHADGVLVEAELGWVGGKATQAVSAHAPGVRTDPGQAVDFVAATGVDSLAVAVGTSHAMTERTAVVDLDLVSALRSALDVPLVLHGSSGVPDDGLRAAVRAGITKVNVGTALNAAWSAALRAELGDGPDPRPALTVARRRTADVVAHLLHVVS